MDEEEVSPSPPLMLINPIPLHELHEIPYLVDANNNISEDPAESVDTVIIPLADNYLPLPSPSTINSLHASDFFHCERSTDSPFVWKEMFSHNPDPLAQPIVTIDPIVSDTFLDIRNAKNPLSAPPALLVEQVEPKLRFPKSYFSWFKSLKDFNKSEAVQYFVDSGSALKDYLSAHPQLDVQIYHNAGRNLCCDRPPPSVNSCVKRRREVELTNHLSNLPKFDLDNKIHTWFGTHTDSSRKIHCATNSPRNSPPQDDFSESYPSGEQEYLGAEDAPNLSRTQYLQYLVFFILQLFFFNSYGNFHFSLLTSSLFFAFLGKSAPSFFFGSCFYIGSGLDLFFQVLWQFFNLLRPSKGFRFSRLRPETWVRKFKIHSLFRIFRFLEWLSTIFLANRRFQMKMLLHPNLRNVSAFLHHHRRQNQALRRYQAKVLTRRNQSQLRLFHLNNYNQNTAQTDITTPLYISNNVPLIHTILGSKKVPMIIDSGSPVNIMPYHLLQDFERNMNYTCTRYDHDIALKAHNSNSLRLKSFGALIPVNLKNANDSTTSVIYFPFLLEECNTSDVIIGMPSIQQINVHVHSVNSTCTLTVKPNLCRLKPVSPVPVYHIDGQLVIPSDIPLEDGIYNMSNYTEQSFHNTSCKGPHDPRLPCPTSLYNHIPEFLNCLPVHTESKFEHIKDDNILIVSNTVVKSVQSPYSALSGIAGVVEYVSPPPRRHVNADISWPDATLQGKFSRSDPRETGERTDLTTTLFDNMHHVDIDEPLNVEYIFDDMEKETNSDVLSNSFTRKPTVSIKHIFGRPDDRQNSCHLWFVGPGPNFSCLFSDTSHCSCLRLKNKNNVRRQSLTDKRSKIIIVTNKTGYRDIYFSINPSIRICDTPKFALFIQLLNKIQVTNIIVDASSHSYKPKLVEFMKDFVSGFDKVHVGRQSHFSLYLDSYLHDNLSPPPINFSPPPSPPPIHHIEIHKDLGMRGSDSLIPDSILEPLEAFPPLPVSTYPEDLKTFLSHSGGEEKEFLQDLLTEYSSVVSKHSEDIGKINDKQFDMDIILKDPNVRLPIDLPFQTTPNKKMACAKIVEGWISANIVEKSSIRTHANRLTVTTKHINKSDFDRIIKRLKDECDLDYSHLEQSEFSRINPSLLTSAEVSKGYRCCLDARAINELTADEIVCSPNPDQMISELMNSPSDQSNFKANADLLTNVPKNLMSYTTQDSGQDDDKLYYSSLDIRSAHTSMVLTKRASEYLNVILPDYQTVKFIQAPFGLKCINSRWNSFITTALHDLVRRKLVYIYADDIVIIARGRKLHRLVLIEIFRIFKHYNVKVSLNKCFCFVDTFHFLGHKFTPDGIKLTDERISGISQIKPPVDLKGLQRLLGTFVYIGRFIPDLQQHLLPLTAFLNKSVPFVWGPDQTIAVSNLKEIVKSNLTLKFIDANEQLALYCDSSCRAGGTVLFQTDKVTQEAAPIAFFSRKYNVEQTRHYSALELELINLLDSLSRLKNFINISSKPVKLFTDGKAILFLLKSVKEGPNAKLARLSSRLAQFDLNFEIIYTKPTSDQKFLIADFLSRSREYFDVNNLPPPPMKSFRRVEKLDIQHDLHPGQTLTMTEMISSVHENPHWFISFPTPDYPFPHETNPEMQTVFHLYEDFETDLEDAQPDLFPVLDPTPSAFQRIHSLMFLRRDLSPVELIKHQYDDKTVKGIIDELKQDPELEVDRDGYFLKNQILHKRKKMAAGNEPENSLIVIPVRMLPELVAEFHVAFGHLGRDKLTSMLSSLYHSPKLLKYCQDITSGCHLCQLIKSGTSRLPPLVPSKTASYPMNILAIDFFTVPSYKGFKTVLIGVDHFSGFIFTRACRSESSPEVVAFLQDIFSKFGSPISIKSDNGTSLLRSRSVRNLLALWGVENATLSLAYTPVHNGKVERQIRAFRALVRALSPENVRGWYTNLQRITFLHNSTPRTFKTNEKTVLASPFELFLRRKPIPIFPNPSLISDPTAAEHFQKSQSEIEELEKFVSHFLAEKNKEYIKKMNIHTRQTSLKVGDLCLLKDLVPPQAGDLPKKYFPTYRSTIYILRLVKDSLAILEDPLTGNILYQNVRFVKKYKGRDQIFQELSPELQKVVGSPFNPLNFSTRKQLLDFLSNNQLNDEILSIASEPTKLIHSEYNSQVSLRPNYATNTGLPDPPDASISRAPSPAPAPSTHSDSIFERFSVNSVIHSPVSIQDEFSPTLLELQDAHPPISSHRSPIDAPSPHPHSDPSSHPNSVRHPTSSNPWKRFTRAASRILKK